MTTPPEDDPRLFAPGTHGCHEALHVALMFAEIVDEYFVWHPAIKAKPEWAVHAETASRALFALCQAMGRAHFAPG
ncbi:MAG: hypothetical protein JO081_19950 [Alphaproteobacteria bacterium]|nr:hypothetical protein [Alphaproteobacteria bacterium]